VSGPFITGTAGSGTGQYFTDGSSNPIMVRADTVWALPVNAGAAGGAVTWQNDIDNYMSTRASQGFNATEIAVPPTSVHGAVSDNGETWDGILPFASGNPGSLTSGYWARVDYLLTSAQNQNMTVFMNVATTTAIDNSGGALYNKTTTQFQNYGTALGNRYKTYPNVIWIVGEDYFGTYDSRLTALLTGIRSSGDTHMVSIENYDESTSRFDIYNNNVMAWGTTYAQYNTCYSYNTGYNVIEYAYGEASPLTVLHSDGYYDQGNAGDNTYRSFCRNLLWWSLSSGSRGFLYGREAIYGWDTSALTNLTNNTFDNSDLNTIWNTFASLPGWHLLVPDTGSTLVTAGRGTHKAMIASGGAGTQYTGGNTYVTAGITADGTLAVIYIPSNATITVSDTQMAKPYVAKWIDPVNGAVTTATKASTYNHSGTNSAGAADWLLVLQSTVPETSPALEVSGFGSFAGIDSTSIINSVTVSIGEFQSTSAMGACTFQLWDAGTAQIGTTQTGTASTSSSNVSTATFTGVSYSQLATLRVRIFGHQGTASAGATESVDYVSLTVNYSSSATVSGYAGVWTAVVVCG